MGKKKKSTRAEKSEARKRKAAQWLPTYTGTKVVRAYRKKFNVDVTCALRELQELGYDFTPEYLERMREAERVRLTQRQREKEQRDAEILFHEDAIYAELPELFGEPFLDLAYPATASITPAKKKKPKQGLPANWKGHYCKVCGRHRANEKFSGKGHAAHICKECAARQKAERKKKRAPATSPDSPTE